jgi:methylase of polypeptide subunit release factors
VNKGRSFLVERSKPLKEKILKAGTGKGRIALALARKGKHKERLDTFSLPGKEEDRS